MKVCTIEGCCKPARTRGWCATHYQRWVRNGDPNVVLKTGSKPGRPPGGARRATETHCANGHPWSAETTRRRPSGRVICRKCEKTSEQAYWKRRKARK